MAKWYPTTGFVVYQLNIQRKLRACVMCPPGSGTRGDHLDTGTPEGRSHNLTTVIFADRPEVNARTIQKMCSLDDNLT